MYTGPPFSTEFAFDGSELVEWPTRVYGPTCTKCQVRFCGFTGRVVCPGCTPWEEAMPRDEAVQLEFPALSLRARAWSSAFARYDAHQRAGHTVRAWWWQAAADALIRP